MSTLKSLKDRLKWISNTEKQAVWLQQYLNKSGWFNEDIYDAVFEDRKSVV